MVSAIKHSVEHSGGGLALVFLAFLLGGQLGSVTSRASSSKASLHSSETFDVISSVLEAPLFSSVLSVFTLAGDSGEKSSHSSDFAVSGRVLFSTDDVPALGKMSASTVLVVL